MNEFKNLSDIFSGLKNVYDSRKGDNQSLIKEKWIDIVGDFLYKYTRPDRVVKGTLYIKTTSSSWMNEISFMKEEIINSCNKNLGADFVKEVKVFFGDGKLEDIVKNKPEHKLEEKKSYKIDEHISENDKKTIEEATAHIEDEELKISLQKLLMNSRIQEKSLLKQGWKKCLKCKALYNTKDIVCLVCRNSLT
jgi:hypothetical protein